MNRSILRAVGLWTCIGAVLQPISCSSDDCNGPGGLCITPPGGDGNETGGTSGAGGEGASSGDAGAPSGGRAGSSAQGGAGGSSAGDAGSDDGGSGEGGRSGESGQAGESGTAGRGGVAGRGGTSSTGGSSGRAGAAGTSAGGTVGKGGSGGRGGAPVGLCHPMEDYQPTCSYTPASGCAGPPAATGWCGLSGGGGTAGFGGTVAADELGPGGAPGTTTYFPIDDFEDGDDFSKVVFGSKGGWYTVNDCSGLQFPQPCAMPSAGDVGSTHPSAFAMRTFGTGFVPSENPSYAQLGVAFRSNAPDCDGPLDATAADGVSFWAKGAPAPIAYQPIRFSIGTVATTPPSNNGTCTGECWNAHGAFVTLGPDWHQYFVRFAGLQQEFGIPTVFDRSKILGLIWAAREQVDTNKQAGCFDFWVDDVAFFHD